MRLAICLPEAYSFHVDSPPNQVVSVPSSLKKLSRRMVSPFGGHMPVISIKKSQPGHQQHSLNFPSCSSYCAFLCQYPRRVKLLAHHRDFGTLIRLCMGGEFS